jgi:hypothetical protein
MVNSILVAGAIAVALTAVGALILRVFRLLRWVTAEAREEVEQRKKIVRLLETEFTPNGGQTVKDAALAIQHVLASLNALHAANRNITNQQQILGVEMAGLARSVGILARDGSDTARQALGRLMEVEQVLIDAGFPILEAGAVRQRMADDDPSGGPG